MWINPETKQTFSTYSEVRNGFPTVSMPSKMTEEDVYAVGLMPLLIDAKPEVDHTINVIEDEPYKENGVWRRGWVTQPATEEEIAERIKAMVPASVSKRQGRQQLILMGYLDAVEAAIAAIEEPIQRALVKSFWNDSSEYQRNHPQMVQLAAAVGLTEPELDQAFIEASQLDALETV